MSAVVLLGPQRLRPTLVQAVDAAGVKGRVAAVTAGWEEREDEIDEMAEHLGRPVENLRLFRRGEDVFRRDPDLFLAFGDHLERRARAQDVYRVRLAHALEAVRELARGGLDAGFAKEATESAIDAVRAVDEEHRRRVGDLRDEFETHAKPHERDAVVRHRTEIRRALEGSSALLIAGGHVQVLLDRMRLFDVDAMAGKRPVFAWSAGAMVAGEDVVLFHDAPPHGPGNAEVLDQGLVRCRGVLPLPHARRRLRLEDRGRVSLLARRFAPLRCLALDEECRLTYTERGGAEVHQARELTIHGEVRELLPT
jgi:hypothetical protein